VRQSVERHAFEVVGPLVQSRLQRLNALAAGLEGELKEMRRVPPSDVAGPRDMEHLGPWVAQLYPDDELPACRNLTLSGYLTVRDLDVGFEEVLPLTRQLQEQVDELDAELSRLKTLSPLHRDS